MSNNGGIGRDNPHGLHVFSHACLSLVDLDQASHWLDLDQASHWLVLDQGSYWLLLVTTKVQPLEALTNKYKGLKPRNVLELSMHSINHLGTSLYSLDLLILNINSKM
jgi:hypothetical protein